MPGRTTIRRGPGQGEGDGTTGDDAGNLARSLARMRATLQATTNAILVTGNDFEVTDFNDRFVAMWSMPVEVLEANDVRAMLDWVETSFADPAAFKARVFSIYAHEPPTTDVLKLLDGRVIERHSSPQIVDGAAIGRVWSFVDITDYWHTEKALREETEMLAWLHRTGSELTSTLEPQAVAQAATHASTRFSGARCGWFIPNPSLADRGLSTAFSSVAGHSPEQSIMAADKYGALAQATSEWKQPFRCDDLDLDQGARQLFVQAGRQDGTLGVRSLMVIPVAPRPGMVLGALTFEHQAPRGFSDRVQRLIAAMAAQAAVAIDNARLHTQVRRESTERKLVSSLQKSSADRLQNLTRRLMEAEEEERKRLGRELHDRVGANLSALGMGLELLRKQLPDDGGGPVARRLGDLEEIVQDTMVHVRAVLADLRPTALDELGLVPALRHQAAVLTARSGIQFLVGGSEPSPRLAPQCEIAFYRIAQEAWANVMKHSNAASVALTIGQEGGLVSMSIEDDGRGFEPAGLSAGTPSLGLTTMRERAEAIGAILEVDTAVGAGVSVHLSLSRPRPA
jgi:signal transduction histidine kinase